MGESSKYIYGIINSNKEETFGPYGIDSCENIYTLAFNDISATVSDSEILDYTHMFRDALARKLIRHQKVIEKIMDSGFIIIPMKLGTFVANEIEVKDILKKGENLIREIFQKIIDKIEIDVACTFGDFSLVIKEAGEDKEVKELKMRLLANPKRITVDDQMKVGLMVKQAVDRIRQGYTVKIQDALKAISIDYRQHELMDERMVANFAFLIEKIREREFYTKVDELNKEFVEKLNFRYIGPLPVYSFYTLEIKKMQFDEVDWARKKLGILDELTTKDAVKNAYHRQAFSFHPDKNPERLNSEAEFNEVNKAYKMLLDYCEACKQSGQLNSYPFNENEFKENAILVKVRD